jgi:zeaxanthin glucosyltransferase
MGSSVAEAFHHRASKRLSKDLKTVPRIKERYTMKIGFVSMPFTGHLNPMTSLARKLQSRGHEVVFIGIPDCGPIVRAAGLNFVSYCEEEFPLGSADKMYRPLAKLQGLEVSRLSVGGPSGALFDAATKHLGQTLLETGVEALVLDTIHSFLQLVPMKLGIPYAQIWNVLHIDFTGATPACFFSWPHETTPEALARNANGLQTVGEIFGPMISRAVSYAEKVGLDVDWSQPGATTSKLAVITQTPREFDFPGIPWPEEFHYAGPFHDDRGREPIPFPWEKLTDKLLIYASLGTLMNGLDHIYKAILWAVGKLPEVQLVLSVGKNVDTAALGPIPPGAIVVTSAPQIELLQGAALCITHAGLNTTLESLAQGVPMVAIPIAYDQPGVAARIAHHGVGEFLNLEDLTPERLLAVIQTVLRNPSYSKRARYFKEVIANTRGLDVAADVIEQALQKSTAEPVVRELANLR